MTDPLSFEKSGSKGGAIAALRRHRAASPSGLSRLRRLRGVASHIAAHHKLYASLACIAIWAGTFHAIGRL